MDSVFVYSISYGKMIDFVIKIQKWFRRLHKCRKCGSKYLAWKYICVYCYHDRHNGDEDFF